MELINYIKNLDIYNTDNTNNNYSEYNGKYSDLLVLFMNNYTIESVVYPIVDIMKTNQLYIYFPTPFGKATNKQKTEIIKFTNEKITHFLKNNKIINVVIDLRNNYGGDFSVFYDSLISVLPDYNNKIIVTGYNPKYGDVAKICNENGYLRIYIKTPNESKMNCHYSYKLLNKKIYNGNITVLIDKKSMSSSQLIAIMCRDHTVIGSAPELYTNGSLQISIPNMSTVIPYYYFKDSNGKVYKNGI